MSRATMSRTRGCGPIAWCVGCLGGLVLLSACTNSGSSGDGTTETPISSPATTTPSTPTSTTSPTTSGGSAQRSAEPDLAAREQALDAQTNGEQHALVALADGYEAATYDQQGNIQFWGNSGASTSWRQLGSSRYPADDRLGAPDASVSGALLTDMTHATFIVRGSFTGDSSGNAVAFTTGADGWGAIKAEKNGNIGPSGEPVGTNKIGLSYDFGFAGGKLVTKDCPADRAIAECGAHPVTKAWQWTGKDFHET